MIKTIQYLRFFAALTVVFAHANLAMYGISPKITNLGGFGVDVFFVISGFVMPYIIFKGLYHKESIVSVSAIDFVSRRVVRVWPLYLLATIVTLLLSYFVSSGFITNPTTDFAYLFNASKMNVAWFFETMSFAHWDKAPILGIGWTLQLEFVFYCAIAGLLLVGVKKIEPLELGLMLLLFFTTVASFAFDSNLALKVVTRPIVLEFIFGVLLYRLVSADCLVSPCLAVFFIAASVPIFLYLNLGTSFGSSNYFYRPMVWGLLAFLLVWSFISLEELIKTSKLLLLLGDSSYSMYLCHGFLAPLYAFFWMTFHLHESVNVLVYLVSCLLVCQVFAVFIHQRVELPLNAFVKRNVFKGGFAKRLIGSAILLYVAVCLCLFVVSQVRAQSAAASIQKPLLADVVAPPNLKIEPSPDGAPIEKTFKAYADEASSSSVVAKFHLNNSIFGGDFVYAEPVFVGNNSNALKLLFKPERVLSVFNPTTGEQYSENIDYTIKNNEILLAKNTKIQKAPAGFNVPTESDAKKYGVKVGADIQQFQYAVSYTKNATHPIRFYGSLKRLQSKIGVNTLKITFFGDSITQGANTTGAYAQPNQLGYVDLVMASLSATNPSKWLYRNNSVAGWNTRNAISAYKYRVLDQESDLIVLAFGMNDSADVSPEEFKKNLIIIIDTIKKSQPNASVLLVSSTRANPKAHIYKSQLVTQYLSILKVLSTHYPNVAVADVTSAWDFVLQHKNYLDVTGNGLNHPNDFGHRVIADVVLSAILNAGGAKLQPSLK